MYNNRLRIVPHGGRRPADFIIWRLNMLMQSRVWLALSSEAREQYKNWFGVIDMEYDESKRPLQAAYKPARPVKRRRTRS